MRLRISEIHPSDAYYTNRDLIVGKTGQVRNLSPSPRLPSGENWFVGNFDLDEPFQHPMAPTVMVSHLFFIGFKFTIPNTHKRRSLWTDGMEAWDMELDI